MGRRFRKVRNSTLAGVCSGFAYLVGWQVWTVKTMFVLGIIFLPLSFSLVLILLYVLLAIFLPTWPERPKDFDEVTGD